MEENRSHFEFSSRHPPESRVRQDHFQREQAKRCQQRPLEQRTIGGKASQLNFGFFQPINVVVDTFQLATIGGAIKFRL